MEKNVKFRNHFFMVIENLLSLWILWIYFIVSIFSDEDLESKMGTLLVCGGVILFVFILNIITWRKTTFIFDENALIVEKNTITKTTTTIAMDNIATVNINRSFLQAILGIRKVKVDTNSSSNGSSELEIYLSKNDAIIFQQTIMSYIGGADENVVNEKLTEEESLHDGQNATLKSKKDCVYSDKAGVDDIILHCIYTMQIITIVITAISAGFLLMSEAELDEGETLGGAMSILTFVIMGIGIVISALKSFFAYYKLEAVRYANEISISYGFFDKKEFKMPVNRIVCIKIKEPLIGRLFKKAYAEIVCVGMGDEEKELSLISLCTSKRVLAAKLHALLPEFIPEEVKNANELYLIKKEDKRALSIRVIMSVFIMGCFIIGALIGISIFGDDLTEIFSIFGIIVLLMCLLILVYGICKNRTSGYAVDSKYFRIANGAFNREIYFVPYDRIEHMKIDKSPVYKLLSLATANIFIKSGGVLSVEMIKTCYINDRDIELIREKYRQSYSRG